MYENDTDYWHSSGYYKTDTIDWLRSPNVYGRNNVRYVESSENVDSKNAYDGNNGVRPAFYLDPQSVIFASGEGAKETPYELLDIPDQTYTGTTIEPDNFTVTNNGTELVKDKDYEDHVLGNLSLERYKKMSADYEAEQERLKLEIEVIGEQVEQREEEDGNLDRFMELCRKYVDVPELTQTIVNEYIKKIVVYAPDKSGGKRQQRIVSHFNFVDEVEVPALSEPIIAETTYGRRKTA